jgi:hypothetical protein
MAARGQSKTGGRRKGSRPTYSAEIAQIICKRIAKGESLRAICRDNGMPDESTVRIWAINDHDGFFPHYARAIELRAERWAEEIVEISDDMSKDQLPDGSIDHEHVQRSRLRVDTRKWLLSKLLPKKYGDRVELTGADGGPIQHRVDMPAKETREQWLARHQGEATLQALPTPERAN